MIGYHERRLGTVGIGAFKDNVVSFSHNNKSDELECLENALLRSIDRKLHTAMEASAIYASRVGLSASKCPKNFFFP